jgi:hypothetical protein
MHGSHGLYLLLTKHNRQTDGQIHVCRRVGSFEHKIFQNKSTNVLEHYSRLHHVCAQNQLQIHYDL